MLSSRLNAFVIPTSQRIPSGTAIQSVPTSSTVRPLQSDDRGRADLRAELGPRRERVEIVDEARQEEQRAAAEHAPELRVGSTTPQARARPLPRREAGEQMPRPPTSGVASPCQRSSRGAAERRRASGERSAARITAYEATRAAIATSAITEGKGKGRLLAVFVPCHRLPYASMRSALLEVLRCPVCSSELELSAERLACADCGGRFAVEDGMPRMLDDRLPGIAEKRREVEAWPEKARAEGWYGEDDATDLLLPAVPWDDPTWSANEHSFNFLLDRYVKPGQRVLEVGAARCWGALHLVPRGVEYVATDILADPVIGLGRGEFYERHVGPFERVQADGENLPFADGVVRPRLLRRQPPPRARRAADGEGDGARREARRRRRSVERGDASAGRE